MTGQSPHPRHRETEGTRPLQRETRTYTQGSKGRLALRDRVERERESMPRPEGERQTETETATETEKQTDRDRHRDVDRNPPQKKGE